MEGDLAARRQEPVHSLGIQATSRFSDRTFGRANGETNGSRMTSHVGDCTVGVLYCGDLGGALARLLSAAGVRVVTTCEGRTRRTRERAEAADAEILPTLGAVVAESNVVISLVLPEAADQVARQYADRRLLCPRGSLFIEANSIDLQTLGTIEQRMTGADIRFADAAVHGGAGTLGQMGVLYMSGYEADDACAIFGKAVRVLPLGHEIGQATRMKLLMGGLSKGMNLLFLEIAVLAHRAAMVEPFLEEANRFYPELMTAISRMLPTYPQHAMRRVGELESIQAMAQSFGAPHEIVRSSRDSLQAVAGIWQDEFQTSSPVDISRMIAAAADVTAMSGSEI